MQWGRRRQTQTQLQLGFEREGCLRAGKRWRVLRGDVFKSQKFWIDAGYCFQLVTGALWSSFTLSSFFMDWFSTIQISSNGSHSIPKQHPQGAVCPLENAKLLHIFCQNSKYLKLFSLVFPLIFLIKEVGEGSFEFVAYFDTKALKRISAYWLLRYY